MDFVLRKKLDRDYGKLEGKVLSLLLLDISYKNMLEKFSNKLY